MKLKISVALVAACLLAPSVQAADLMDVYRDAQAQDPVYSSARFTYDASREIVPQARAANLLPSIGMSASYNRNHRETDGFPTADYNTHGYSISLSQP
ncbi:MAG: TolC family protein, partial [Usitatibacteraceae bacterium]